MFDGHRGADVAQMCAVQFPIALRQGLASKKSSDPMKAISFAFQDMNNRIKKMKMTDGATAAVALILPDSITLAHVGDARAVLFCLDKEVGGERVPVAIASAVPEYDEGSSAFSNMNLISEESRSSNSSSSSTSSGTMHKHVSTKNIRMRNGKTGFMVSTLDHTAKNRVERRRVDDLGG